MTFPGIAEPARHADNGPSFPSGSGAMSQQIFFAHANGFPSATYGKLFAALAPDYQVQHLAQHGHAAGPAPGIVHRMGIGHIGQQGHHRLLALQRLQHLLHSNRCAQTVIRQIDSGWSRN